ncbi:response regulator transcription factor [Candidatus Avelusimicrobium alvi]|uniref:response regulator transcription factor n=1 Tax=Candidatus Avelusimicrobium alvi TaxID=3416221 RepID=UPI003D0CF5FE
MKWMAVLLVLCAAFPCMAQKNLAKEALGKGALTEALGKNAGRNLLRSARVVQGKILLNGARRPARRAVPPLEQYVLKSVAPTPLYKLPLLLYEPSQRQQAEAMLSYMQVMDEFKDFKTDMDPFLYYQAKPSESRVLPDSERATLMQKISHINARLATLSYVVSPNDPALKAAHEYMVYATETVSPVLRGMLGGKQVTRPDRTFKQEEFFLHTPKGRQESALASLLPGSVRTRQVARTLPPGLTMAVLNDRESVLKKMQELNATVFCPEWKIYTYTNTEDLLGEIRRHNVKFDVILTDIIVPGGGGYYLTAALRDQGFNGVILAATAYQEDEKLGLGLFNKGFDGMFSLPQGFEEGKDWPRELMKGFQNYFYYRDLNGWKR